MNKETLAKTLDGVSYPAHRNIDNGTIKAAKENGLVIVYGASDDLMEFVGAIDDELSCYDGGTAYVDAKGLLDRSQIDDDDDEAIAEFVARKKNAKAIEALWAAEPGITWTYRTDIPHATFKVMEDDEVYCRGIVFALSDLDPQSAAPADSKGDMDAEEDLSEWKVTGSTVYRLMPAGYSRGQENFKNAVTIQAYTDRESGIAAEDVAKRIAACLAACEGIPTEELAGQHITDYVVQQAFLTGMQPSPEKGGFEIGLKGLACQLLAASFAGQFKGSGAINFLEVGMGHPEIGPFLVTMQRQEGKTPGMLLAEALAQRDKAIAAAEFFKNAIEKMPSLQRERAAGKDEAGWAEFEAALNELKEA